MLLVLTRKTTKIEAELSTKGITYQCGSLFSNPIIFSENFLSLNQQLNSLKKQTRFIQS